MGHCHLCSPSSPFMAAEKPFHKIHTYNCFLTISELNSTPTGGDNELCSVDDALELLVTTLEQKI